MAIPPPLSIDVKLSDADPDRWYGLDRCSHGPIPRGMACAKCAREKIYPSLYFGYRAGRSDDDIDHRCRCKADFTRRLMDRTECPLHREGVKSLGQQVREAIVACADHPATLAERAAFLELAAVITDAGAEQLRRFLR